MTRDKLPHRVAWTRTRGVGELGTRNDVDTRRKEIGVENGCQDGIKRKRGQGKIVACLSTTVVE